MGGGRGVGNGYECKNMHSISIREEKKTNPKLLKGIFAAEEQIFWALSSFLKIKSERDTKVFNLVGQSIMFEHQKWTGRTQCWKINSKKDGSESLHNFSTKLMHFQN